MRGIVDAQCRMGEMYLDGEGVDVDAPEAYKWFLEAARGGDVTAQYLLGKCYAEGTGVAANLAEAEKWLQSAAAAGDPRAPDALKRLGLRVAAGPVVTPASPTATAST